MPSKKEYFGKRKKFNYFWNTLLLSVFLPKLSSMQRLQPILDIAEICVQKGVRQVVLSPGSRSAPLTMAFSYHIDIQVFIVVDERAAAFTALGLAQQSHSAVALVCTSGSAGLNYAPAVAEAFFQQVPLVIFTADRPPEWIDQADGQTIRQRELFGKHCKAYFELPVEYQHPDAQWHIERTINEAINAAMTEPQAPVQINCPFREPFYLDKESEVGYTRNPKIIRIEPIESNLTELAWEKLIRNYGQMETVWVVGGQNRHDSTLIDLLNRWETPIFADIISNLHPLPFGIHHQDISLSKTAFQENIKKPDLLITFGQSIISKNLKLFLRKNKPVQHWHLQAAGIAPDTFQSLTQVLPISPVAFFSHFWQEIGFSETNIYERKFWDKTEKDYQNNLEQYLKEQPFSELEATWHFMQQLPSFSDLHLANSMAVRLANVVNFKKKPNNVEIWSNRGTSGIDGCLSTAVGHALNTTRLQTLLIGDLAFFYDQNGLWQKELPNNLRIVLLNNHGGGIFKFIAGPQNLPKTLPYFLTPHSRNAENICRDMGLDYMQCSEKQSLENTFWQFFQESSRPKLLEIQTDMDKNVKIWQGLKNLVG